MAIERGCVMDVTIGGLENTAIVFLLILVAVLVVVMNSVSSCLWLLTGLNVLGLFADCCFAA